MINLLTPHTLHIVIWRHRHIRYSKLEPSGKTTACVRSVPNVGTLQTLVTLRTIRAETCVESSPTGRKWFTHCRSTPTPRTVVDGTHGRRWEAGAKRTHERTSDRSGRMSRTVGAAHTMAGSTARAAVHRLTSRTIGYICMETHCND
jgi:hypothetical protein